MANLFPIIFPFNNESPEMKKLGIQTEFNVYKKIGQIYDETVDIIYGQDFLKKNYDGTLDKGELTDFLIIHPKKGILFLECKGGLIEYDKMRKTWKQNNHFLKTSPFDQAKNGQYTLINLLKEEFGEEKVFKSGETAKVTPQWVKKIPIFTAAIFPNTPRIKGALPPDIKPEMILWAENLENLEKSINIVFDLSEKSYSMIDDEKNNLIKTLIGDNLKSPFKDILKYGEHHQEMQFNKTQQQFISSWFDNSKIIIKGLAGTGKTLLAAKTAIKKEYKDKKVLILTKTVGISKFLQVLINKRTDENFNNIMIINIDKFVNLISRKLKIPIDIVPSNFLEKREFYDTKNPKKCLEIFNDLPDERFDLVIVDEAQDFHQNWFEPINSIVKNYGTTIFFYDPLQTTRENTMVEILRTPNKVGYFGLEFNTNYRNTSTISNVLSKLIKKYIPENKLDYSEHSDVNIGRNPTLIEANSFDEIINKTVLTVKNYLDNEKFKPMDIGVLYLGSMDGKNYNSKMSMTRELKKLDIKVIGAREYERPYFNHKSADEISFSDVNSFKGLEKTAVILANFGEINEKTVREIYTGLSRARGDLTIVTYKKAIDQLKELI